MQESYTSKETISRAGLAADAAFFHGREPGAEQAAAEREAMHRAGVSRRRADAHRLVKAAKSPTDRYPGLTGAYFNRPAPRRKPVPLELDTAAPHTARDLRQPGTWAVVERRDWSGEHRLRMETRPGAAALTPDNSGDRITAMLTDRGARKISESCYFMACKRGGFSTFVTLTLTPEARAKLGRRALVPMYPLDDAGFPDIRTEPARAKQGRLGVQYQTDGETPRYNVAEVSGGKIQARDETTGALYTPLKMGWVWSVQKEASRFFEAASKMYQRGWQYKNERGETVRVAGSRALYCVEGPATDKRTGAEFTRLKWWREPLSYLWVAENPDRIDKETGEVLGENPHIHILMRWRVDYRHFQAWAQRIEKLWGQGTAHLEKIKDPQKAGSYVAKAAGYLSKAQGKGDQGEIRGNRYGISSRARAPGWIETERHQVGLMGWLMAEAKEIWDEKHGEKIRQREYIKAKLEAANDPGERQKIGRILEGVRKQIEPLARPSKYAVLWKSEDQKTRFFRWAEKRGWTPEKQNSLWLEEWRRAQLRRRFGNQAGGPSGVDWGQWFALADSGAVAINDEEAEARFYA